jgi:cytochrome P450
VRPQDAFELATKTTAAIIQRLRTAMPGVTLIDLRRFVPDIVAQMSKKWFAVPDGDLMHVGGAPGQTAHCPHDFGATARYIFSPNPTEVVEEEGQRRGRVLLDAARSFVRRAIEDESVPPGTLFEALYREMGGPGGEVDQDQIARVLVGSVHGFVAPAGGSCFSVLHQWTASEQLWRYQQSLLARKRERPSEADYDRARAVLMDGIVRTLQVQPFPYVLHRTALRKTKLGSVEVEEGERVVLGLVSGTQDQPGRAEILLGGDYGTPGAPVHACPGWGMAYGMILGVVSTLLEAGSLGREGSTVLSLQTL